jgi:hypothetical protein
MTTEAPIPLPDPAPGDPQTAGPPRFVSPGTGYVAGCVAWPEAFRCEGRVRRPAGRRVAQTGRNPSLAPRTLQVGQANVA